MTVTFVTPVEAKVAVGDTFVCSWGYDQTNIDFYRVVGLTPKGVKIQKWTSARHGDFSGHEPSVGVMAGDGPVMEATYPGFEELGLDFFDPEYHWKREEHKVMAPCKVETKRIRMSGDTPAIKVYSFAWAYRDNTVLHHETGLGWGH